MDKTIIAVSYIGNDYPVHYTTERVFGSGIALDSYFGGVVFESLP
jgi:hypothetical protein